MVLNIAMNGDTKAHDPPVHHSPSRYMVVFIPSYAACCASTCYTAVKMKNSLIPTSLQKQRIWVHLTCLLWVAVRSVADMGWCAVLSPWPGAYWGCFCLSGLGKPWAWMLFTGLFGGCHRLEQKSSFNWALRSGALSWACVHSRVVGMLLVCCLHCFQTLFSMPSQNPKRTLNLCSCVLPHPLYVTPSSTFLLHNTVGMRAAEWRISGSLLSLGTCPAYFAQLVTVACQCLAESRCMFL